MPCQCAIPGGLHPRFGYLFFVLKELAQVTHRVRAIRMLGQIIFQQRNRAGIVTGILFFPREQEHHFNVTTVSLMCLAEQANSFIFVTAL